MLKGGRSAWGNIGDLRRHAAPAQLSLDRAAGLSGCGLTMHSSSRSSLYALVLKVLRECQALNAAALGLFEVPETCISDGIKLSGALFRQLIKWVGY